MIGISFVSNFLWSEEGKENSLGAHSCPRSYSLSLISNKKNAC